MFRKWISVEKRLPRDGQTVMIFDGNAVHWRPRVAVAIFERGRSAEQLLRDGCVQFLSADEHGNNLRPYCWRADHGPLVWFGQDVTHWMPLPKIPIVYSPYFAWLRYMGGVFNEPKK